MRLVIPVKPFTEAKRRLEPAMDAAARARLATDLFRHVFAVASEFSGSHAVIVVSRSPEILHYAQAHGATGLPESGEPNLNAAVGEAAAYARATNELKLLVVASDLPLLCATDLAMLAGQTWAIAPDRRGCGTNALLWPAAPRPGFHFGEDSFARHCAEAKTCGFIPHIVSRRGLGHDVDLPEDLIPPPKWLPGA